MEQSSGRSLDFVGVSREVGGLRDGTLTNKGNLSTNKQGKPFQARGGTPTNKETPFQASKGGGTLTNKGKPFQARETPFKQGVSSDQM